MRRRPLDPCLACHMSSLQTQRIFCGPTHRPSIFTFVPRDAPPGESRSAAQHFGVVPCLFCAAIIFFYYTTKEHVAPSDALPPPMATAPIMTLVCLSQLLQWGVRDRSSPFMKPRVVATRHRKFVQSSLLNRSRRASNSQRSGVVSTRLAWSHCLR